MWEVAKDSTSALRVDVRVRGAKCDESPCSGHVAPVASIPDDVVKPGLTPAMGVYRYRIGRDVRIRTADAPIGFRSTLDVRSCRTYGLLRRAACGDCNCEQ